ncbi:SIR2 family histone deacetylase, putative [Talaromyces stipitatus ATCC 10500]|uniref:NAD-dependent protein deacetylase n=1 Tax=Talaromyces stipitatus (strain ATCC 10500 / CBS 375.48 / QM 6759 / NRRL 1006) TaxID=441959 RepID=B8LT54_TALSN|nr:SIR2 family histone deacetylase, putative [Talaromyces stipitatus ATCC 10500]EED23562.1 SIR2 family histone deacetylase, putative [Talaromyces stipitatus ATCC 10500]
MGNEASTPIDGSVPPATLRSRDLDSVAKYILEKDVRRIVVLTGAGISTSAGIPDFRSPETGLYSNLAHLELPDPEAVFNITFFRENPVPFYTLAKELYPGRYRPTIAHSFITLLHRKGRLLKLFTQNIDCLEREAGLSGDMIIDAHGSFASQHCIDCKSHYPDELMKQVVAKGEVPHCIAPECNGLVKPDIVFFGEALPGAFFANRELPAEADLCIIMGTSLTVQPFASLPSFCRDETPRLLINMEQVGGLGSRADDVLLLGDCDEGVRKLAKALGWLEELEALWEESNPNKEDRDLETAPKKTRDERLHDEVERLTADVDRTLHVSNSHQNYTRQYLDRHLAKQLAKQNAREERDGQVVSDTTGAPGEEILRSSDDDISGISGLTHVFPHLVDKKPSW